MIKRTLLGSFVLLLGCLAEARADDLTMKLTIAADKSTKTAESEAFGVGTKLKTRGVFKAAAGKTLTVKYTVSSTAGKAVAKDVLVHLFAVKIDKVGQTTIPPLNKDVAAESALTMDFKPKDKAVGELSFTIDTPGVYLLRLETQGAARGVDGHEHVAALDVVIELPPPAPRTV
jgi:hypothetical protein